MLFRSKLAAAGVITGWGPDLSPEAIGYPVMAFLTLEIRQATVLGGRVTFSVAVMGSGPAVLYLHPAGGLEFDTFLEDLATRYTLYAPYFPGTAPDAPYEIHHVQTLLDVLLAYEELIGALGLPRSVPFVRARRAA